MTRLPFFAAVVFFVLLFSAPTLAEIKSITISDDSRPIILFEKFRFTQTGHVTVSVSSVSVSVSSPIQDSSRLGFFFLTEESILQVLEEIQQNPRFCVLDSHYLLNLFTFNDQSQFNQSYSITSPNDYSLFFANCVPETEVSMKLKTEMYNLDPNGSKVYLQPGLTRLPGLYLFFSFCYFTLWVYYYLCFKNNKKRIHILMAALLLVKSLSLFCAFEVNHNVKVTGTAHGWNICFHIFRFIGEVLLFAVIVLIGTGWVFLKPKVQEMEKTKKKKLLMIVILFQVLANIASIVIEETGPFIEDWVTWNLIFLLADMISCCAILFAMCCCCRRERSKTEGKAVKNLPCFRRFYVLVIVYFLLTRIVVVALKLNGGYEYQWVNNVAEEVVNLAFYVLMFYMFRAMERNEDIDVGDDHEEEDETAELALKKEEFDKSSETI